MYNALLHCIRAVSFSSPCCLLSSSVPFSPALFPSFSVSRCFLNSLAHSLACQPIECCVFHPVVVSMSSRVLGYNDCVVCVQFLTRSLPLLFSSLCIYVPPVVSLRHTVHIRWMRCQRDTHSKLFGFSSLRTCWENQCAASYVWVHIIIQRTDFFRSLLFNKYFCPCYLVWY